MNPFEQAARIAKKIGRLRIADRRDLAVDAEASHLRRVFARYDVDCVFDVGGNRGQYARMLRRRAGYRGLIVTFEPIPEAAAELRTNAQVERTGSSRRSLCRMSTGKRRST